MDKKWSFKTSGIPDGYFIRGKVPMTKEEIRAIVISKLRLEENSVVVDVGAGTGSISIEAALVANKGMVYAIDHKEEATQLQEANKRAFQVDNLHILRGRGREIIKTLQNFDRVIIGGSGGEMEEIITEVAYRLPTDGRLVITTVTLESLSKGLEALKKNELLKEIEVVTVAVSKGRNAGRYTLMEAQNPINIISATKGGMEDEG